MAEVAGLATTDTFETSSSALEQAGLDREAFLKIFLTQLQYQDPLDPQDSSELSAQLATFSDLEQSIIQVGQLREINEHLEELIEASTRAQAPPTLDPVSLIGKQIEVGVDEIFVPEVGASIELGFDLAQSDVEFLNFLALDASGASLGLGSVSAQAGNPPSSTFTSGHYALVFQDGNPQLRAPGQNPTDLAFLPLTELPNGELGVDLDSNAEQPAFLAGSTYGFQVEGSGNNEQRTTFDTTTSGTVTAVRIVNGFPVLIIGGQGIDPSKIVQIQ